MDLVHGPTHIHTEVGALARQPGVQHPDLWLLTVWLPTLRDPSILSREALRLSRWIDAL
jgi:hypothetical protein